MFKKISFTVNGKSYSLDVDVRMSLLELLRNQLGYTGAKQGCGVGECGACSVLIDGTPYDSCIYLAVWADGKAITTIEGVAAKNGELSKVQKAFIEEGAVQCGFCTPGLVLTTTALTESGKDYTRDELKRELSGHLCRCTGYQNILKAAEKSLEGHICTCVDSPHYKQQQEKAKER
ncbi:aerobic-type carbon monoxide dehydrogenase, small subunit CoxS/CutS-like protein [Desulfosporosinus acidiphilus SJ4]|uniref:Aerobic-type carbon monoxide dehydrogenase, small subunit CoxS/CutS-like protein n=1 Tax=Desulfosporosinus acidiphilus (strain DSM 22704 / JCM 16185 / SJ4) TaxID=646529 RepID=I4D5E3_DESAJ|nr:xanthine dehydrogenase subunit XdhC [Desulfosporosinus acidiphilus]AFM41017.1 aerobic-type carbon monoxide dehydrogenase, small subunit CoxS/CutS-like protein [Desulfosporosinus acidiphilus SJ4]